MGNKRYEQFGKLPEESHEERLDEIRNDKAYYAFTEERYEAMKPFYEKYGRSWYIFSGTHQCNDVWIEQFRVITYNENEEEE
jgi:hypothetical protein